MMESGIIRAMKKMTSITTDQNEIVSSIQKLSPEAGDVLLFYIKTDEYGTPMMDLDVIQQTVNMIEKIVDESVSIMFLLDKICLSSIGDMEKTINILRNYISYIREAAGYTPGIENGTFREPKIIDMKKVEDPFKRVL